MKSTNDEYLTIAGRYPLAALGLNDDQVSRVSAFQPRTRSPLKITFGLRQGLSRPSGVAQPLQRARLCAGFAPWLVAKSLRLASKSNFEMASRK